MQPHRVELTDFIAIPAIARIFSHTSLAGRGDGGADKSTTDRHSEMDEMGNEMNDMMKHFR